MPAADASPQTIKRLIIESLNLEGTTPDQIGDDDPLFGDGLGLDSVDALELVVALEKAYDVKIQSHEVDPQVFSSVATLSRFVQGRIAAGEDSVA